MNISSTNAIRRIVAGTLCTAIYLGLTAPPAAAAELDRLSVTVKYGDLDVTRPQGATILYGRIRAAAKKVCSPLEAGNVAAKMRFDGCIDKAISDAVKTIQQPELTAFDSAKRGAPRLVHLSSLQSR